MDNQLQNILRQIEHQKEETLTQLNGKERVIQDLSTKNSDLEAQLTNYRELFEQQMAKMDTIKAQLREKDV